MNQIDKTKQNKLQKKVYLTLLSNVTIEFNSINECADAMNITYRSVKELLKANQYGTKLQNFFDIRFEPLIQNSNIIKYDKTKEYDTILNNFTIYKYFDDFGKCIETNYSIYNNDGNCDYKISIEHTNNN